MPIYPWYISYIHIDPPHTKHNYCVAMKTRILSKEQGIEWARGLSWVDGNAVACHERGNKNLPQSEYLRNYIDCSFWSRNTALREFKHLIKLGMNHDTNYIIFSLHSASHFRAILSNLSATASSSPSHNSNSHDDSLVSSHFFSSQTVHLMYSIPRLHSSTIKVTDTLYTLLAFQPHWTRWVIC